MVNHVGLSLNSITDSSVTFMADLHKTEVSLYLHFTEQSEMQAYPEKTDRPKYCNP